MSCQRCGSTRSNPVCGRCAHLSKEINSGGNIVSDGVGLCGEVRGLKGRLDSRMARLRELIEEHHSLVSSLEALTDEPTSGHDPGTQSPIPPLSESRRNSREVDRAVRTARAAAAEAFVRSESTGNRMFHRLRHAIDSNLGRVDAAPYTHSPLERIGTDDFCVAIRNTCKEACCICLDDMDVGLRVSMLACGHKLHQKCANSWLERSLSCPLCKQKFTDFETVI